MSSIFSPSIPTPPPPPPPPSPTSADPRVAADAQKKMDDAAAQQRLAQGRAATLLTGGQGDTSQPTLSQRTLLGA